MEFNVKEKLGPLPIWAWGLIFGAAALAFYYIYARGRSNDSGSVPGPTTDIGYVTKGLGDNEPSEPEVATNDGWLADASRRVADSLGVSISDVRGALYKWLTGQDYTQAEKLWIDKALALTGSPPQGTTGSGKATPNPPTVIKEQVKVPVRSTVHHTTRTASIYTTLTGSARVKTVPKGTVIHVVSGGSPTRARILLQAGTFAYIARSNLRKG